jgi:hypothetical protein
MLLTINGQQFRVKGVFEYDPSNPLVYENGDIVYVPNEPKLYIYYNDRNASPNYSNHAYLYPLWYKDVVTNLYDYISAEILQEWQTSLGNTPSNIDADLSKAISDFLRRPVATEILASILNAKFGTGILTPDGNQPLDLNSICRNGRYIIVLGDISRVNNLPSVITTNFSATPPYPNNIIGLDVWVGRKYDTSIAANNANNQNNNKVAVSGYAIRQTIFTVVSDTMIIATRSASFNFSNSVVLDVSYDVQNQLRLNTQEELSQIMNVCGNSEQPIQWNNWTVLQQYPVNVLFNYFANRIDTLITSFNHATDRMVLGIRPINYRLIDMNSTLGTAPDGDPTPGNLCLQVSLADIPMSLHSLSQISAVVINAVIISSTGAQEVVQQFTIPIPYSRPITRPPYLPNSKIVFSSDTKFYVFYTPWDSSTRYGVVLNILSKKWDLVKGSNISEKQNNITDIVLMT